MHCDGHPEASGGSGVGRVLEPWDCFCLGFSSPASKLQHQWSSVVGTVSSVRAEAVTYFRVLCVNTEWGAYIEGVQYTWKKGMTFYPEAIPVSHGALFIPNPLLPLDKGDTPAATHLCRVEMPAGRGVWYETGLGLNRGLDIYMQPGYKYVFEDLFILYFFFPWLVIKLSPGTYVS